MPANISSTLFSLSSRSYRHEKQSYDQALLEIKIVFNDSSLAEKWTNTYLEVGWVKQVAKLLVKVIHVEVFLLKDLIESLHLLFVSVSIPGVLLLFLGLSRHNLFNQQSGKELAQLIDRDPAVSIAINCFELFT